MALIPSVIFFRKKYGLHLSLGLLGNVLRIWGDTQSDRGDLLSLYYEAAAREILQKKTNLKIAKFCMITVRLYLRVMCGLSWYCLYFRRL